MIAYVTSIWQFEFEECLAFLVAFGCMFVHHFVQYVRWKRSSKMPEFPHSVLILATKNCCAQFRKQNNHSIGIIGSLSGKKTVEFSLSHFVTSSLQPLEPLSQSTTNAGDWFLCRWWATSLRPTHHYQWSSRSYFWFLGKKKERLKKIRARPTSLGQYGSIRNDKVQRLCLKKKSYSVDLCSIFWIWIEWW